MQLALTWSVRSRCQQSSLVSTFFVWAAPSQCLTNLLAPNSKAISSVASFKSCGRTRMFWGMSEEME